MIKIRFIVICFLFLGTINAQEKNISGIVGNKIPNFQPVKTINGKNKTLKLTDYADRLIIIDFWATSCSGCVAALPKMEQLQTHFGNNIKVIPVTYESADAVSTFLKANKYTKSLKLESVVEDKILHNYFKHLTIPHEVWINKGKIIAITTSEYVDEHNIKKVLGGDNIDWPIKYDYFNFDRNIPIFSVDSRQIDTNNTALRYSAICGYKDGVNSEGLSGGMGIIRNNHKKQIRSYFINQPIFNSYLILLSNTVNPHLLIKPTELFSPNQLLWEVSDNSWYKHEKKYGYEQDWIRAHGICFESIIPDSGQNDKQIYQSMIREMNSLLGLNVRWEKRKLKVFNLVNNQNEKISSPLKGDSISISNLVYELNQHVENPYVFNQTNESNKKIVIDIRDWTDLNMINNKLKSLGYTLKEEETEVDKLVFTEIDGGLLIDPNMQAEVKKRKEQQVDLHNPAIGEDVLFLRKNKNQKGIVVLPSGLQYKVLREGDGGKPDINSKVSVNYVATLVNGRIFDSSLENGKPAILEIKNVIKGWQEALPLMREGAKWILFVPAVLAYGEHTSGGTIPPNSTLIFELELLKILPS